MTASMSVHTLRKEVNRVEKIVYSISDLIELEYKFHDSSNQLFVEAMNN